MSRSTLITGFLLFTLVLFALPAESQAQTKGETKFSKEQSVLFTKALRDGKLTSDEAEAIPLFKVPAHKVREIVCSLSPLGVFQCVLRDTMLSCPSFVQLETPSGTTQQEIDCERPDETTETCECEFKQ
jgi:hypothetical protein